MAYRFTRQEVTVPQDKNIHTWSMTDGQATGRTRTFQDHTVTTYYTKNGYGTARNGQTLNGESDGGDRYMTFSTSTFSANARQEKSSEVLSNGSRYKTRVPTGFHTGTTQRYRTRDKIDEERQDHSVVKAIYQNGNTTTKNYIDTNLQDVSARYATDGIPTPKKLHIDSYQPTERVQESERREVNRPNKLTIPTYSTSVQILKEVIIQPKKMDTARYLQQDEPQPIKKEVVTQNKLTMPTFESQTKIKRELIPTRKLDTTKFVQKEEPKPIQKEIVTPNKLTMPTFESQTEIKRELIPTRKLDANRHVYNGEREIMKKESVKPNRVSIPIYESQAEIRKQPFERNKLDASRYNYHEEPQALIKESVKPNRVSIPNYECQAEIRKQRIERNKLDATRYNYHEEPQVFKKETVKPNKLLIPNFESNGEIKQQAIETRNLDRGRFPQHENANRDKEGDARLYSSWDGGHRRTIEMGRSDKLKIHQPTQRLTQRYF